MMSEAARGLPPLRLTVSQLRVAASCPRIAYFDFVETRRRGLRQPHVTRIWKEAEGDREYALGSLFHQTVERFQAASRWDHTACRLLETSQDSGELARQILLHIFHEYLNRERLYAAAGEQQRSFMRALQWYVAELADILTFGRDAGISLPEMREQMFGDQRREVDVTFAVGADGTAVNIHGRLDYVFYDWRTTRRRIIDYKLMPAHQPDNDLFQVSLYALMHHVQHGTQPDAAVLYLHPRRVLMESSWEEVHADRQRIYDLLASVAAWSRFDESTGTGLKPPGEPMYCATCPWESQCTARLGPKPEGAWLTTWRDAAQRVEVASGGDAPPEPLTVAAPVEKLAADSAENQERELAVPPASQQGSSAGEPHNMLWVGYWEQDHAPVHVPFSALATHMLIAGAAGSGKTWLAKVILEEAVRQGAAVIAVDPQGDLVQLLRRSERARLSPHEAEAFDEFSARADIRLWTPGSSLALRMSLDPLRLPSDEDLVNFSDPQRRHEERENLLQTSAASLVDLAQTGREIDCQQTLVLDILRHLTRRHRGRVSLGVLADALFDPQSVGVVDADRILRRAERERLARKLGTFLRGPNSALFAEGTPLDVEQLLVPSAAGKMPLNIVYLNHLASDEQKQFVVAVLATEIYRWMMTRSPDSGPFLMFYLDEARDFLPAGNRQTAAKQPLRRLFSQGRKYRVGCAVAAQSPRSVEYEALSNCSTKLIGRLESQQDVERVREWFSREGRAPDWLAQRKGAPAGSFLGRWPLLDAEREGQSFRSRALFSAHSGAWPPDRVEQEWRSRDL